MVVYFDLTQEIIDSFNECVKSGDYKPFFKENQKSLDIFINNLKFVEFEKNSKHDWISKEFVSCLRYFFKFDPKNPGKRIAGVGNLEKNVPEVSSDIKDGISRKDWSIFYWKHRSDADYMIAEARRQGIINISVFFGSGGFSNFETRDEIVGYMNEEVVQLPPVTKEYSREFGDSGTLVQHDIELQNSKKWQLDNLKLLKEIADLKKSYQEKLELLETRFEKKFEEQEQKMKNREEKMASESRERLFNFEEKQEQLELTIEEFERLSRVRRENDHLNLQQLEVRIQEQLKAQEKQKKLEEDEFKIREKNLDKRFDEIKLREENLERKMEDMMEPMKLRAQKTAEEFAEKSRLQMENYDINFQKLELRIQEQLRAREEQMKLREDTLTMREDELDEKVEKIKSMEEQLNKKVDEIRLREENLKRKMEEMMGMVKLVVDAKSTVAAENPSIQITDPIQDKTIIIEPIVTQSDPNNDVAQSPDHLLSADKPTSEDDELQKMEEQFQKDLAEQNRVYEEKLRIAQEKRREMNEKAAEERRQITGDLTRAASFRRSFHS